MALCRFSSDCWRSDVYVYEDASGGVTVHVANNRHVISDDIIAAMPTYPEVGDPDFVDKFVEWNRAWRQIPKQCPREQITSPVAGKSFNVDNREELSTLLHKLANQQIHVPDFLLDDVDNPDFEIDFGDEDGDEDKDLNDMAPLSVADLDTL